MARSKYPGDLMVNAGAGSPPAVVLGPGSYFTVWSAQTGGSQYVDLKAEDGVTTLPTSGSPAKPFADGNGNRPTLWGPDAVNVTLWCDTGVTRYPMSPVLEVDAMLANGAKKNVANTFTAQQSFTGTATAFTNTPTVSGNLVLHAGNISAAFGSAVTGYVLKWNGTAYAPSPDLTGSGTGDNFVHPEAFYVGGDVDDGEAIQRAIDSLSAGQAIALIPGHAYVSSRQIVVHDCQIYGFGAKITGGATSTGINLKLQGEAPALYDVNVVAGTSVAVAVSFAGSTKHATIRDGSISGLATAGVDQGVGINATGIAHVTIQNVHFKHCVYGILTNSTATDLIDTKILGCTFDDISGDAIELNHPGSAGTGGRDFVIDGNYISCRANSDVSGLPGAASAGFGVGIAHCNNVTVTGNTFYDCRQHGVHIEDTASKVTITGNSFRNGYESIWAIGCDTLVIANNVIVGGTYGIHLTYDVAGAGHWVERVVITGNQVSGTSNTAICHETDHNPIAAITGNMLTGNVKGLEVNVPGSGTINYLVVGNLITGNTGAETTFVGVAGTVASNIVV